MFAKVKQSLQVFGLLLGLVFLFWSFSLVSWNDFFEAIASVEPLWCALSAASLYLSMCLRSLRWHVLTGLPIKDWYKVWEASCIGYMGTAIYPARAGDVMRILRLQQLSGMGGGKVISSSLLDRVLDGLGLCCLLLIVLISLNAGLEVRQGLFWIALIFLFAAVVAMFFVIGGHKLSFVFERLSLAVTWGGRLQLWYEQFLSGLQILRSPQRIAIVISIQGIVSLLDILSCWFLIQSFGWTLPFIASASVLVCIAVAASLPSPPGYVGVYQIAALFALRPFGIDDSDSVAYGTIIQVLTLVLFIGSGMRFVFRKKPDG